MNKLRKQNACFPSLIGLVINKRQLVNECLLPPSTISSKHKKGRDETLKLIIAIGCINDCVILD